MVLLGFAIFCLIQFGFDRPAVQVAGVGIIINDVREKCSVHSACVVFGTQENVA